MDKARKFIRNVLSDNDALQGLLGPDTDDVGEVLLPIILSNRAKKSEVAFVCIVSPGTDLEKVYSCSDNQHIQCA